MRACVRAVRACAAACARVCRVCVGQLLALVVLVSDQVRGAMRGREGVGAWAWRERVSPWGLTAGPVSDQVRGAM